MYTFLIVVLGLIPISILYYYNVIDDNITNILLWIIFGIAIFIGSYKISTNMKYKGIINGLIYFVILMLLISIASIFIKVRFNYKIMIYYLVLAIFSIMGGIIGKNLKTDDN